MTEAKKKRLRSRSIEDSVGEYSRSCVQGQYSMLLTSAVPHGLYVNHYQLRNRIAGDKTALYIQTRVPTLIARRMRKKEKIKNNNDTDAYSYQFKRRV